MTSEPGYQSPSVNVATSLPKRGAGSSVLLVPVVSTGDDDRPGAVVEAADSFLSAEAIEEIEADLLALEATGGFETVAAASLAAAGLPVVVVNPAQIRAFARAIGQRAKTDPIDAAVIARFAEATKPEPRTLPDAASGARPGLPTNL